ncbi:hypothetical protein [Chryseobacterium indoltheticum]
MKSLKLFIAEHLGKLILTTAQKSKEKPCGEIRETFSENGDQET